MEELYGEMMEVTTIDQERKNLQYLTNEMFKAAKSDLREDKVSGNKENGSIKGFDKFITDLEGKTGKPFTDKEKKVF
jgi:hypothetical protein